MAKMKSMGTGKLPLAFAAEVSQAANASFGNGAGPMMEAVTPVTRDLLKYWFAEPFTNRPLNFHAGQRQAILNVIYLHEVLKTPNIRAAYAQVDEALLSENDGAIGAELTKSKYGYPKYLVKMATGTGKTWVMHALLVWQYLNAKYEVGARSGRWTKNFLFVAPGLIVYERLLDAFCGRRIAGGETRDFTTSDIRAAESLFVPPEYREAVFSFLQNGLVRKDDFGRKVTGDGVLAVMNWHAFLGDDDLEVEVEGGGGERGDPDGKGILDDLLPAKPGVAAGNALESLDAQFLRGGRLDFLKDLPDLMLVNDEAHHVHGGKGDEEESVKWQQGIDLLAEGKGDRFLQLDFSATPYEPSGTGRNMREDFFPHVVVDFDLKAAITRGLVKAIVIDKRKELNALATLDYNAVREGNRVVGLSDGQRLMLRAGLTKLAYLEKEFAKLRPDKHPKMMVVCEDTAVTPFVEQFLLSEGLSENDILTVDSNKKGEVGEKDWAKLKGRLFAVDKSAQPKVILSVLMLREGFDVNNICVIVPLRASNAQILLEQTIGRGLRLMWREPEYQDVKDTSRHQLLVERVAPDAVLDMLYIVEHPAFISFYERFLAEGLAGEGAGDREGGGTSDLVAAELKDGYERYDMFWPLIIRECEEVLSGEAVAEDMLRPFTVYPLETLKRLFAKEGETFIGQELTVKTLFGAYDVHANLFNASCYNEYLQGIIQAISRRFFRVAGKQTRRLPALQVNLASIAEVIDRYIRNGLFAEPFDPFHGSDWKVLLCANGIVTQHIVQQIGALVNAVETGTIKTEACVRKVWFSSVPKIIVREGSSLPLVKTVYTRTGYPSHGGGLERDFLEFVDRDAQVERFIKVNEARHTFARIAYLRKDGLMGEYIPDFLVATDKKVFVIETKAANQISDDNVQQKRIAAINWCKSINALSSADRMEREWAYVLLSESDFYSYRDGGGTILDMCAFAEVTEHGLKGEFDFA